MPPQPSITTGTRETLPSARKVFYPGDALQSICEQYQSTRGFFARRELVAVFRRPESVAIVWRQWFTKAPGEFVAELVLVQRDGRYLVDHVMVF